MMPSGVYDKRGKKNSNFKHGLLRNGSIPKEYWVWKEMVARCTKQSHRNYKDYGGRGVSVCQRWREFSNFYADMCPRPTGMTLERVDNDGAYSPENCIWAGRREQSRNTRRTAKADERAAIVWSMRELPAKSIAATLGISLWMVYDMFARIKAKESTQ